MVGSGGVPRSGNFAGSGNFAVKYVTAERVRDIIVIKMHHYFTPNEPLLGLSLGRFLGFAVVLRNTDLGMSTGWYLGKPKQKASMIRNTIAFRNTMVSSGIRA
jgi:hypothetical protein